MSGVHVKSILVEGESVDEGEIRRFPLSDDEAKSFKAFSDKLVNIYKLENVEFNVYYKDDDGDLIRISTDEELIYMLNCSNKEKFKAIVKKVKPNVSSTSASSTSTSASASATASASASASPSAAEQTKGVHHPGVVCDNCEKEIYGIRFKCAECPDFDLCSVCEQDGKHTEHKMIRISIPRQRMHPFFNMRGRRHFQRGGAGGGARRCPGTGPRRPSPGEPFHPQNLLSKMLSALGQFPRQWAEVASAASRAAAGGNASAAAASNSDNTNENTNENAKEHHLSHEEYLRNIGEAVAAMLDPLGIDVLVDVESNINQEPSAPEEASKEQPPKKESEEKMEEDEEKKFEHDEETGVSNIKEQTETLRDLLAEGLSSLDYCGEWTHLDADGIDVEHIPEKVAEMKISEEQTKNLTPDQIISQSTAQMVSMGFSNTDGWLTALLTWTNGDVEKAIQTLAELGQNGEPTPEFLQLFTSMLHFQNGDVAKVIAALHGFCK